MKDREARISRRDFIGGAITVAAFTIVPRHVLGGPGFVPPSEELNIACIGVGGQGGQLLGHFGGLGKYRGIVRCGQGAGS